MNSQRGPSGGWGIVVPFFLAMFAVIWPYAVWHGCKYGGQDLSGCGAESEWVWNARSWIACGIWWAVLASPFAIAGIAAAGKRRPAPPKGRLRVEALPDRPPVKPASPGPLPRHRGGFEADRAAMRELGRRRRCPHLNAVKVNSVLDSALVYHCWCPDCDPDCRHPLPAGFRLPCCGTGPGDGIRPARHVYNCPHWKGTPS